MIGWVTRAALHFLVSLTWSLCLASDDPWNSEPIGNVNDFYWVGIECFLSLEHNPALCAADPLLLSIFNAKYDFLMQSLLSVGHHLFLPHVLLLITCWLSILLASLQAGWENSVGHRGMLNEYLNEWMRVEFSFVYFSNILKGTVPRVCGHIVFNEKTLKFFVVL